MLSDPSKWGSRPPLTRDSGANLSIFSAHRSFEASVRRIAQAERPAGGFEKQSPRNPNERPVSMETLRTVESAIVQRSRTRQHA